MTYILVIWTVIVCSSDNRICKYDWRPIGDFHQEHWERKYNAKQMCERAAQELNLKTNEYRCVQSR